MNTNQQMDQQQEVASKSSHPQHLYCTETGQPLQYGGISAPPVKSMSTGVKVAIACGVAAALVIGAILVVLFIINLAGFMGESDNEYIAVGNAEVLCIESFLGKESNTHFASDLEALFGSGNIYMLYLSFDFAQASEENINDFFSELTDNYGFWRYETTLVEEDDGSWRDKTVSVLRLAEDDSDRVIKVRIFKDNFNDEWTVVYSNSPEERDVAFAVALETIERDFQYRYGFSVKELANSTAGMQFGDFTSKLVDKMRPFDADFDYNSFWRLINDIVEDKLGIDWYFEDSLDELDSFEDFLDEFPREPTSFAGSIFDGRSVAGIYEPYYSDSPFEFSYHFVDAAGFGIFSASDTGGESDLVYSGTYQFAVIVEGDPEFEEVLEGVPDAFSDAVIFYLIELSVLEATRDGQAIDKDSAIRLLVVTRDGDIYFGHAENDVFTKVRRADF